MPNKRDFGRILVEIFEDKERRKGFLASLGILMAIIFLLGFMAGLKKTEECTSNPLIWGIERFNEANDDNYDCECIARKEIKKSFIFDATELNFEGWSLEPSLD